MAHVGIEGVGCRAFFEIAVAWVPHADQRLLEDSTMNIWGFPKISGTSWGPYNKDYSILGSMLRFPYLGHYHI